MVVVLFVVMVVKEFLGYKMVFKIIQFLNEKKRTKTEKRKPTKKSQNKKKEEKRNVLFLWSFNVSLDDLFVEQPFDNFCSLSFNRTL